MHHTAAVLGEEHHIVQVEVAGNRAEEDTGREEVHRIPAVEEVRHTVRVEVDRIAVAEDILEADLAGNLAEEGSPVEDSLEEEVHPSPAVVVDIDQAAVHILQAGEQASL